MRALWWKLDVRRDTIWTFPLYGVTSPSRPGLNGGGWLNEGRFPFPARWRISVDAGQKFYLVVGRRNFSLRHCFFLSLFWLVRESLTVRPLFFFFFPSLFRTLFLIISSLGKRLEDNRHHNIGKMFLIRVLLICQSFFPILICWIMEAVLLTLGCYDKWKLFVCEHSKNNYLTFLI